MNFVIGIFAKKRYDFASGFGGYKILQHCIFLNFVLYIFQLNRLLTVVYRTIVVITTVIYKFFCSGIINIRILYKNDIFMDRYCSDCNTPTVRSSVGYMCPSCGRLHQFDKAGSMATMQRPQTDSFLATVKADRNDYNSHFTDLTAPPKPNASKKASDDLAVAKPTKAHHKKSAKTKRASKEPDSIKNTMKRLLVPELPAPHYHRVALSAVGAGSATLLPSAAPHDEATNSSEPTPPTAPVSTKASAQLPHQDSHESAHANPAVPLAAAAGIAAGATAEQDAHIMHAQDMQDQLEDTSSTNVVHVIAMVVAVVLLIVAFVLAWIVLAH